jgi:hypothetical protein
MTMFAEVIPENETEERELWQAALELYPDIRRKHGLACEFIPGKGIKLYGPVEPWLLEPEALSAEMLAGEDDDPRWDCGSLDRMAIRSEFGWVLHKPPKVPTDDEPFEAPLRTATLPLAAGNTIVFPCSDGGSAKQEKLALASCGVRILKHARIQGTVSVHLSAN